MLLFTIYLVAHTLWTSLRRVMILFPGEPFVGLANYRAVLESAFFATALFNSLWFTVVAAPLIVLLSGSASRICCSPTSAAVSWCARW